MFLWPDLRISTSEFPVFQSTDHVVEKTNNSVSQCNYKLRQLFSKSQLTKERNTYLIHFLLGTVFMFEYVLKAQFSGFFAPAQKMHLILLVRQRFVVVVVVVFTFVCDATEC